jgi:GTP-binding protein
MTLFQHARFAAGAAELAQLPQTSRAEVAFAGRSNAGKSSAINAILNRKKLAFVSKTPGRTQQLNYFDLGSDRYLVDLPGYGYAKVSKAEQSRWENLLPTYLQTRDALRGLVVIMDVRHPFTALDELLFDNFALTTKPIHVLLTKADKLSHGAAKLSLRKVESGLTSRFAIATCQLFSSVSGDGVREARGVLEAWLSAVGVPRPNGQKKPPVKGE